MHLQGTMDIGEEGHLRVGGCDAVQLAGAYGTPLIVYDEWALRTRIREFHAAFANTGAAYQLAYATKAFCTVAMCQLAAQEGCALDVVSGGELFTALHAGVDPHRIHLHGNNKSVEELEYAVDAGIGLVIVDNFHELSVLEQIAGQRGRIVDVLLRVAPGVEAHTHEYMATGQQDSKFGFDWSSGQVELALERVSTHGHLRCRGLHAHIGSQIFDSHGFIETIHRLADVYQRGQQRGLPLTVLNLGGGFGIRYTAEDEPDPIGQIIAEMVGAVRDSFTVRNMALPAIWIEPGRSIAGPAAVTLYSVGSQKVVPGVRNYVAVDGGMTDNPRLALYGAKYEAALANRMLDAVAEPWSVAGRCCETGDMLIWDAPLPQPRPGDLLVVFSTGAYNYSMASHYNRVPNPAVVFVRDGRAALVVERETWADLVAHDRPLIAPYAYTEPVATRTLREPADSGTR